jgi:hypothetical protein
MCRRTTRKELFEECERILGSVNLTEEAKIAAVEQEVELFFDDLMAESRDPEVSAWRKRDNALMRKYSPKHGEIFFCPSCREFVPKRPAEVESNDKEFDAIRDRKEAELVRKILGEKAA